MEGKFTDRDLLYAMIERLDYDKFKYGNDGPWYTQGEYHDIEGITHKGDKIKPHGTIHYDEYDNGKPNGMWMIYI